ncbi:MAG: VTT domain-containing protein [Hyphomonadaceae bacterium]|nr:VTT domain-containing protein [Hyphomonadaceae bacterium]
MKKIAAFLNNMDARAWRTIWVSLALLGGVGVLMILGKSGAFGFADHIDEQLAGLRNSPWALPATIAVFILSAFIAAPQFVLMAGCIVAFGPWLGSVYAMAGQMAAAWLHFYMGRFGGRELVDRYGGDTVNRLSRFIGRNDFLASMIVRSVPTAPAIVVNMAFGASKAKFWRFMAGCFIGSIPKTLIVALLGQSVMSAMGGGVVIAVGGVIAVVSIWIVVALAARRAVQGEPDLKPEGAPEPAPNETVAKS